MGAPQHTPAAGTVVAGKYELLDVAGRGGMATVWRAHLRGSNGFKRTVAVKQMHPHLAEQPVYVDMFVEEARVGAELFDSNIAQVYDFVAEHGNYYLVMEYVEGIDLGTMIHYFRDRGEKVSWDIVTAIGIGLLRGLAAAHERTGSPIVHRDVSPHNILLTPKGMVKVIDFGLSLARDRTKDTTDPGVVKGKMSYLSPEVVLGERPTPACDQFAVGSVLWETLVGRRLFEGANDLEIYGKLRNAQVQPLRPERPDIPNQLVRVVHRALTPTIDQRYPSTREMARQLGMVLKKAKARHSDLHEALGSIVMSARARMNLGGRTGDREDQTPVESLTPEVGPLPVEEKRGLLHRLPFFGRRR